MRSGRRNIDVKRVWGASGYSFRDTGNMKILIGDTQTQKPV